MTLKMNHFNPIRNQNYSLFFQNSPFASSLWPLNRGLFLPRSLGPKRLHSKWATSAPKIVLYFTHQNGPIFGAKTDLLDLECIETSLKPGFSQIFSCCPKNLSCPNIGGAAAPLAPPARTPMATYRFWAMSSLLASASFSAISFLKLISSFLASASFSDLT